MELSHKFGAALFFLTLCFLLSVNSGEGYSFQDDHEDLSREMLAANAEREGVVVTESGLQYEIVERGYGLVHPREDGRA